jgi:hypothetical protein
VPGLLLHTKAELGVPPSLRFCLLSLFGISIWLFLRFTVLAIPASDS